MNTRIQFLKVVVVVVNCVGDIHSFSRSKKAATSMGLVHRTVRIGSIGEFVCNFAG